MDYSISVSSLEEYDRLWHDTGLDLIWQPIFILPPWLKAWVKNLSANSDIRIVTVRQNSSVIGVAPLLIDKGEASIIGCENVCDYFDFPVAIGREKEFFTALFSYLRENKLPKLNARVVCPDSIIYQHMVPGAKENGFVAGIQPDEVAPQLDLPETWDEYLKLLDTKQRHELRRKIRRFESAGQIDCQFIIEPDRIDMFLEVFLPMFVTSREDKKEFLDSKTEAFFRNVFLEMATAGLFRGMILKLDSKPVAVLAAFDYQDGIYLYNSGFDRQYSHLSVGIISKAFLIKDSIEREKKKYDFLKGNEAYKYHLGGKEVRLYQCIFEIK